MMYLKHVTQQRYTILIRNPQFVLWQRLPVFPSSQFVKLPKWRAPESLPLQLLRFRHDDVVCLISKFPSVEAHAAL